MSSGARRRHSPAGPAVIACRRRYHCPAFGCLVDRSRDCSRLGARGHCMPALLSLPCRRLLFHLVTPGLISVPLQCPAFSRLRASRLRSPNHRTFGAAMAASRLFLNKDIEGALPLARARVKRRLCRRRPKRSPRSSALLSRYRLSMMWHTLVQTRFS